MRCRIQLFLFYFMFNFFFSPSMLFFRDVANAYRPRCTHSRRANALLSSALLSLALAASDL